MTQDNLKKGVEFILKKSLVDQTILDVFIEENKRGRMDSKKIMHFTALILTYLLDEEKERAEEKNSRI